MASVEEMCETRLDKRKIWAQQPTMVRGLYLALLKRPYLIPSTPLFSPLFFVKLVEDPLLKEIAREFAYTMICVVSPAALFSVGIFRLILVTLKNNEGNNGVDKTVNQLLSCRLLGKVDYKYLHHDHSTSKILQLKRLHLR